MHKISFLCEISSKLPQWHHEETQPTGRKLRHAQISVYPEDHMHS